MKNRPLVALIAVFVNGLFLTSALAEEAKEPENAEVETQEKPIKRRIAWCGLYEHFQFLTGEFDKSGGTDHLERNGLGTGMSCNYNNRSRLSFAVGAEFYIGKLEFTHEQATLKGSASYVEIGMKEWLRAALNLNGVKIGVLAGVEFTRSNSFELESLQMDFGGGYLDLTKFGNDHLSSTGELEIWELGLNAEFPFRKKFSVTFGALYQKPHVVVRVKIDDEVRKTLQAFNYDVSKVEREYDHSANFFYLTPGVKWCGDRVCVALTVPWGVFLAKQWAWGLGLKTDIKF